MLVWKRWFLLNVAILAIYVRFPEGVNFFSFLVHLHSFFFITPEAGTWSVSNSWHFSTVEVVNKIPGTSPLFTPFDHPVVSCWCFTILSKEKPGSEEKHTDHVYTPWKFNSSPLKIDRNPKGKPGSSSIPIIVQGQHVKLWGGVNSTTSQTNP